MLQGCRLKWKYCQRVVLKLEGLGGKAIPETIFAVGPWEKVE